VSNSGTLLGSATHKSGEENETSVPLGTAKSEESQFGAGFGSRIQGSGRPAGSGDGVQYQKSVNLLTLDDISSLSSDLNAGNGVLQRDGALEDDLELVILVLVDL
jgi:hypothetical protein